MPGKIYLIILTIILLCSIVIHLIPPEVIEVYVDRFPADNLPRLIYDSDTIILARVENTLHAERKDDSDIPYVITPANLKVIRSLKGDYKPGDIVRIDQPGGVAGGIDYRPSDMYFYDNGETRLFFLSGSGVLDSEYADNSQKIKGHLFDGKTTDEAASIINDNIRNWKTNFLKQVESFSYSQKTDEGNTNYSVDKTTLEAQISYNIGFPPSDTEKWDNAKWDSFISDLDKCGVFDWKENYGNLWDPDSKWWAVNIGYFRCEGAGVYPDNWDSFIKVIDKYFGTLK